MEYEAVIQELHIHPTQSYGVVMFAFREMTPELNMGRDVKVVVPDFGED